MITIDFDFEEPCPGTYDESGLYGGRKHETYSCFDGTIYVHTKDKLGPTKYTCHKCAGTGWVLTEIGRKLVTLLTRHGYLKTPTPKESRNDPTL